MKKILFLVFTIILCLSLGACGEKQKAGQDILGQWISIKDDTYTITFSEDGTCRYTGSAPVDPTPNTLTLFWGEGPYKYAYNTETEIITIYSTISHNYEVVTDKGNITLASINGPVAFVRAENYEAYHSAYLAEEKVKIDAFYNEGKEGRTELKYDTPYAIAEGLNMTVTDYVIVKNENFGFSGEYSFYLKVTLENSSSERICIRQDGVKEGSYTVLRWSSDVYANVEAKQLGNTSSSGLIFIGDGYSSNASDYFFKYEELGKPRLINSGNHIYLKAGSQGEYYLYIPNVDAESAKELPTYATLTFHNYDFFYKITGLEQKGENISAPESAPTPTPKPTPAPTPKPTPTPTPEPIISTECGHSYSNATCVTPQTCTYCGATNGSALGHDFKDATCESPKTCAVCNITQGGVVGHIDNNGICKVCGKTRNGTEYTEKVLNYLKENHGKKVTAEDIATALGMEKRSVDGIFTEAIQRKGLGVRTPAEIQLEDGTYKQVKYLSLTPAGMAYTLWSQ